MVRVGKYLKMETYMKDLTLTENPMAKANINGKMEHIMKVNLPMVLEMAKEYGKNKLAIKSSNLKVIIVMIKNVEKVTINGLMEHTMKVNFKMINVTVTERYSGMTGHTIRGSGKMD